MFFNRKGLLFQALGVMILLGALHFFALSFFLYWQFWWFDLFMHFLGGIVLCLGAIWATLGYAEYKKILVSSRWRLSVVLFVTAMVALLWEIFEFHFGIYGAANYWNDTIFDFLMALLGALFCNFYVQHLHALPDSV